MAWRDSNRVGVAFETRRSVLRYEYDFGSTTELSLRAFGRRAGGGARSRVRLLARNDAPQYTCDGCGQPAVWVCPFWDGDNPFVCEAHSAAHGCDDAGCHLPVVNSPRMGVCGYTG